MSKFSMLAFILLHVVYIMSCAYFSYLIPPVFPSFTVLEVSFLINKVSALSRQK